MHLANKGKNSVPVFHNTFMKGFEATNSHCRRKMKKCCSLAFFKQTQKFKLCSY